MDDISSLDYFYSVSFALRQADSREGCQCCGHQPTTFFCLSFLLLSFSWFTEGDMRSSIEGVLWCELS